MAYRFQVLRCTLVASLKYRIITALRQQSRQSSICCQYTQRRYCSIISADIHVASSIHFRAMEALLHAIGTAIPAHPETTSFGIILAFGLCGGTRFETRLNAIISLIASCARRFFHYARSFPSAAFEISCIRRMRNGNLEFLPQSYLKLILHHLLGKVSVISTTTARAVPTLIYLLCDACNGIEATQGVTWHYTCPDARLPIFSSLSACQTLSLTANTLTMPAA